MMTVELNQITDSQILMLESTQAMLNVSESRISMMPSGLFSSVILDKTSIGKEISLLNYFFFQNYKKTNFIFEILTYYEIKFLDQKNNLFKLIALQWKVRTIFETEYFFNLLLELSTDQEQLKVPIGTNNWDVKAYGKKLGFFFQIFKNLKIIIFLFF